ncbi:DNA repair protein RAD50 [Exophiala viscosa]|uniref:DNA repair protein RAD50 n=1 Tax=Exophiala viscosa TaxID=2486360 RepID=UPI00219DAA78|nr:DNA repair protein RAD50 [Exophiala viscosa]
MLASQDNAAELQRDGLDSTRQDRVQNWKPSGHELLVMLTLSVVSLMVSLDATTIITSLSTIVRAFDASTTQGFWIGTSYLLTCAVTMPFTASISNILGRPHCLFASILFFAVGTILCVVAHDIGLLLAGRCVQGVGGGGIIILSGVIFTDIVPLRFRPKYLAIIQAAWALGTGIGPLVGGVFATPRLWRWVFYLMFPFCGIGLICVPVFVRLKPRDSTWTEMFNRVDWLGGFLFISSATSFLIAISWGGTQEPWSSFRTIVPLVVGSAGLVVTILWERYGAAEPFLRHSLFQNRSAFAVYAGTFFQGLLLYGQLYYIPFFFESVKLDSPVRTGVSLLAVTLTLVPSSVVCGGLITRIGTYRWAIWSGWIVLTLATGLTIIWDAQTSTAVWVIVLILLGLGHGLLLNSLNCASQAVSLPGDEGAAFAMYAFLRSLGMAIGLGIGGSVFQNVMSVKLRDLDLATSIARNAEAYITVLKAGNQPDLAAVIGAYVYGFRGVFAFLCGLGGLALVMCCFVGHFVIDKELDTEHELDSTPRVSWRLSKMTKNSQSQSEGPSQSQLASPKGSERGGMDTVV